MGAPARILKLPSARPARSAGDGSSLPSAELERIHERESRESEPRPDRIDAAVARARSWEEREAAKPDWLVIAEAEAAAWLAAEEKDRLHRDMLAAVWGDLPRRTAKDVARAVAAEHVAEGFRRDQSYCDSVAAGDAVWSAVVAGLRASGLTLRAEGGGLVVGPRERVTPALAAAVVGHKAALLAALEAS